MSLDPIILRPSPVKWSIIGAVSLALTATGIHLIVDKGEAAGWLTAGMFGLVTAFSFAQLIPGLCWLELDETGFRFKSLQKSGGHRWSEIETLSVSRSFGNSLVAYETNTGEGNSAIGRLVSNANTIPDTYGMRPLELCALMKRYAEHHDASVAAPNITEH